MDDSTLQVIVSPTPSPAQDIQSIANESDRRYSTIEEASIQSEMTLTALPNVDSMGKQKITQLMKNSIIAATYRRAPISLCAALDESLG